MVEELERLATALGDRYRIESELGRGGMAIVYLAEDLKHRRKVAIKVLRPDLAAAVGPQRFLREIEFVAKLNHPHILTLIDSGQADGFLYFVVPFVEGKSLRDRLQGEKQLSLDETFQIAKEVADALSHAHSFGIVHRDIKPENVLFTAGHAVVSDFGIARALRSAGDATLTGTGVVVGTPAYMSPEQAFADRTVDARSDVYSLGCLVYEMLAGEPPFTGPTPEAILARKALGTVPTIKVVRPTVPDGVEDAIIKALAVVPADRFATPRQFIKALEESAHAETIALPSHASRWVLVLRGAFLAALLLAGVAAWWTSTHYRGASTRIGSLAVIPFANLSGNPEQQYFVDGVHEAVIGELAKAGNLKVISRTSAMHYRNSEKALPEIARELGVDGIVEGSIVRDDAHVRITIQLIDGRTDRHLWSHSYERDVGNLFALQSEIARAVAEEIEVKLSPAEGKRVEAGTQVAVNQSPNPAAYDAYLKGRFHYARGGPDRQIAIGYYKEAIAKDTAFAKAYAALAEVVLAIPYSRELTQTAVEAANKAVALDPTLPEAHTALAMVRMADWDWTGSEAEFQRALQLDRNSSAAHQWYAQLLRETVRLDEALREARLAQELDPLSLTVRAMVGWVLFSQRRYNEALGIWNSVLDLEPEFGLAIYNQGLVYWMQDRGPEVILAAQRAAAVKLNIQDLAAKWLLAVGYALSGQRTHAEQILSQLEAQYSTRAPSLIAVLYHVLGKDEKALDWLEKAFAVRERLLPNNTSEPPFDGLRGHPRFRLLRANMGLP